MNAPFRLAVFTLGLGGVFASAVAVGRAVDPVHDEVSSMASDHGMGSESGMGGDHDPSREASGAIATHASPVGGLSVADDELRLVVDDTVLATETPRPLRFRILDSGGTVVTDFDPEQGGVDLHLVVVSRDLSGFQHLHPEMATTGTWSVPLALASPGVHRAFVDVTVDGSPHTLGIDLFAPGDFAPEPLPEPTATATVDGYEVTFARPELVAGDDVELSFSVSRNGAPVIDLDPYLGARGHLVGLRQGDLAYLHLHPEETAKNDTIVFQGTFPSTGAYRLFLQFQHEGVVHTVPVTVEVTR
jgi:hypothetical protein